MVEAAATLSFDQIHFSSSEKSQLNKNAQGKLKFAAAGFGWKNGTSGEVYTERFEDIDRLQWLRSVRGPGGFQLRIFMKSGAVLAFEGFDGSELLENLRDFCHKQYNLLISSDESSGKGWNWGKLQLSARNLNYSVNGKLAFDLPLKPLTNALVAAKNELVLEFASGASCLSVEDKDDVMTELRFYLPDDDEGDEAEAGEEVDVDLEDSKTSDSKPAGSKGSDSKRPRSAQDEAIDSENSGTDESEDSSSSASVINLANQMLNEIKSITDFSKISGEIVAALPELACIVPRGRYRMDMFSGFLRLHGKSYDYKIDYSAIQKVFLLPKTDDAHILLLLALDPPLRQGQTRYPHLIFQFPKEERLEHFALAASATCDELLKAADSKLQREYRDVAAFELVSVLMRGLAGQKVIVPGGYKSSLSSSGMPAVKCAVKANEGALYPLEKNFLFLPKPTIIIPHAEIAQCSFSRVSGPTSSFGGNPRSFDLKISIKASGQNHLFSNIAKEELEGLLEFLRSKQIPFAMEEENQRKSTKKLKQAEESEVEDEGEDDESSDDDYNLDDDDEAEDAGDSEADSDFDEDDEEADDDEEDGDEDEDDDEDEDEEEDDE